MTQTICILAETANTVTIGRSDFDSLMQKAEDAEDLAALAAHNAEEARVGRNAARKDYLTLDETERLLRSESPVRVWREKRGFSQRELAKAAGMQPGYVAEIETGMKPGSIDALSRIAVALSVPMHDLLRHDPRLREPDHGPVVLRLAPVSIGVAEGRRGARMEELRYATVEAALGHLAADWQQLRGHTPSLWDEETKAPIFDADQLLLYLEPE